MISNTQDQPTVLAHLDSGHREFIVTEQLIDAGAPPLSSTTQSHGCLLDDSILDLEQALTFLSQQAKSSLREPQLNCLKSIAQAKPSTQHLSVSILPTGVGKTLIQGYMAYALSHLNKEHHIAIITPTRILSGQINNDFSSQITSIDPNYAQNIVAVYSDKADAATPIKSLLENDMIAAGSGKIFIFCNKSFNILMKMASNSEHEMNQQAQYILRRFSAFIFDEEHMTFNLTTSKNVKECIDNRLLPSLQYLFGFTATSPADPDFKDCFNEENIIQRQIIFYYSAPEATAAGFIRPISYVSHRWGQPLSMYMQHAVFTDNTPILDHVGIVVCNDIKQLQEIEMDFIQNLPGISTYAIHSKNKNNKMNIASFCSKTSGALAIVVNMLQEGFNHPQARYTICLKETINDANLEQRAGRIRRKTNVEDSYTSLFIHLSLGYSAINSQEDHQLTLAQPGSLSSLAPLFETSPEEDFLADFIEQFDFEEDNNADHSEHHLIASVVHEAVAPPDAQEKAASLEETDKLRIDHDPRAEENPPRGHKRNREESADDDLDFSNILSIERLFDNMEWLDSIADNPTTELSESKKRMKIS